ncbi:MAG: ATP-dependent DNA helicase RecG [Planctomycetia bacterium]|nr:ATP-dependent DNA helicase RecG [Planctomycetia bacterium]
MNPLFSPIANEPFVGPRRAEILAKLPIRTPGEMLFYFPRDYEDFSNFTDIKHLVEGEQQTICARILSVRSRPTVRGSLTTMEIEDGTYGLAELLFFNQRYRADNVCVGQIYLISGKPKSTKRRWQIPHPVMRLLSEEEIASIGGDADKTPTAQAFFGLQPVYRLTEGLPAWELRRLARGVIQRYAGLVEDAFPTEFREKYFLLPIAEAIEGVHFPKNREMLDRARRRFVFQELFQLQLALEVRRRQQQIDYRAPILEARPEIDRRIRGLFPYDLTQGQLKAIGEITRDTASGRPMNRLIQGDVGCGKTTVAVYAVLLAVAHGFQAAIMAPTEVLARQHVRTLRKLLTHSPLEIVELVGGLKPAERKEALQKIASGTANIVVGTQALLQKDVEFAKLAMVIIDEQHKFGVNQRAALRKSGESPHYLVMTATPIPRSVTMTLFGDLDLTMIRDLPPGRQKVKTYVATHENRDGWWTFFRKKLQEGAQGYVVVPRIGDFQPLLIQPSLLGDVAPAEPDGAGRQSSKEEIPTSLFREDTPEDEKESEVANLQKIYRELVEGPLVGVPIGVLHGKMSQSEKEQIMFQFRTGELKVLVSTQVIEVGVDIPNATVMAIDSAEFFGLAQLHQLRGRVARGPRVGYCCVFASNEKEETLERLRLFASTTDGFTLSETDFELRGPGNLFGTQQHGLPPLLIADLLRDREILQETRVAAREILAEDPGLANPDFRRIRQQMLKKYGTALELGDVG